MQIQVKKAALIVAVCGVVGSILWIGYSSFIQISGEQSSISLAGIDPSIKEQYSELRKKLTDAIEEDGAQTAYAAFLEAVPSVPIDTHTQAHIFGEALYSVEGLSGIEVCDDSLRFGCYHSFFGRAIYEQGIGILPELDAACRSAYGDTNTKCQHGLGHGLIVYTGYEDLLGALELCETIPWQETGGCSGGVFMEYNFHTMEQVDDGLYVRPLDDDPFAPCNTLPERFRPSCYLEQVQWWEKIYDLDFTYIGTLCEQLPKEDGTYYSCFRGVGNHWAENALFDQKEIERMCQTMPNQEATELCYEGVSWLIVDEDEHKDLYTAMCSHLTGERNEQCVARLW
jgi:hypothetical protein